MYYIYTIYSAIYVYAYGVSRGNKWNIQYTAVYVCIWGLTDWVNVGLMCMSMCEEWNHEITITISQA